MRAIHGKLAVQAHGLTERHFPGIVRHQHVTLHAHLLKINDKRGKRTGDFRHNICRAQRFDIHGRRDSREGDEFRQIAGRESQAAIHIAIVTQLQRALERDLANVAHLEHQQRFGRRIRQQRVGRIKFEAEVKGVVLKLAVRICGEGLVHVAQAGLKIEILQLIRLAA